MSVLRTNKIYPRDGLPAGASGGGIIQVVSSTNRTQSSTTSNSVWTAMGPSASITPTSASNKIIVQYHVNTQNRTNGAHWLARIYRNGSTFQDLGLVVYATTNYDNIFYVSGSYLDSPASTSSLTYDIRFKMTNTNTGTLYVNYGDGVSELSQNDNTSFMTLMEVSG